MRDSVFFDSNIIVYAYSLDDLNKRGVVSRLSDQYANIIISTQTVNELINVLTKKKKIDYKQVGELFDELSTSFNITLVDNNVIKRAIGIASRYSYSYYDSLMISSALLSGCSILYTEDMHHNHNIENALRIINPFVNE